MCRVSSAIREAYLNLVNAIAAGLLCEVDTYVYTIKRDEQREALLAVDGVPNAVVGSLWEGMIIFFRGRIE